MPSLRPTRLIQFLITASLALSAPVFAGPHEHGVAHMDIALEGNSLQVSVKVPLESLLGYERAPRSAAEKAAAAALLDRFRTGQPVLALPSQAHCKEAATAQVKAPLIEGQSGGDHGDLQAQYRFECAQVGELRHIDVTLFDLATGIKRVRAQIIGPKGQSQSVLRRNKRQLQLGR